MLYDLMHLPKPTRRSIMDSMDSDIVDQREVLFDTIFTIDPRTGLPSSDLTAFMTNKVSPEIKDFIQQELLKPMPTDGGSSDLTDDELVMFTRQRGESVSAYKSRLVDFIDSQQEN